MRGMLMATAEFKTPTKKGKIVKIYPKTHLKVEINYCQPKVYLNVKNLVK